MDILTLLIILIHENGISSIFCSFIFYDIILFFFVQIIPFFINFIPKYLIVFGVIENELTLFLLQQITEI